MHRRDGQEENPSDDTDDENTGSRDTVGNQNDELPASIATFRFFSPSSPQSIGDCAQQNHDHKGDSIRRH
jgi:hypothetical protein